MSLCASCKIRVVAGETSQLATRISQPERQLYAGFMRLALLALMLISGSACSRRAENAWPATVPVNHPAIVFAPVDLGPLAADYPAGAQVWADDLAARIDLLNRNGDGFAGLGLPPSQDPAWTTGTKVPGANLVVLTSVTAVTDASHGTTKATAATALMRALDSDGREVWRKSLSAEVEGLAVAKILGPEGRVEVKAGWAAVAKVASALADFVLTRSDHPSQPPAVPVVVLAPPAAGLVSIHLDSVPTNADVLIDGRLRGTTPCTVDLPSDHEVTVTLERAGALSWSRKLMPTAGLSLTPALAPAP